MQSENEVMAVNDQEIVAMEAQAEEMPFVELPVVEVVRDFNINDRVLFSSYDYPALIVGKAQYLNRDTMYLIEYQANQQGQKTAWAHGRELH